MFDVQYGKYGKIDVDNGDYYRDYFVYIAHNPDAF